MNRNLFPAYAGVILAAVLTLKVSPAFPRLRGGDPIGEQPVKKKELFSPPTRG